MKTTSRRNHLTTLAGVYTETVRTRTGRDWNQWCDAIDGAGGADMTHREIARMLHDMFGLSAWWGQMVAVGYEQATGRRRKHQKPEGFQVSRTRTLPFGPAMVYRAVRTDDERARWAGTGYSVRTARPFSLVRLERVRDRSVVEMRLVGKPGRKTSLTVQHGKLPGSAEAERMKARWADALARLERRLAHPAPDGRQN